MKKVGVLSLQGDFAAHGAALQRAGAIPVYVREPGVIVRKGGVLSLQGDFAAHGAALQRAGAIPVYVRERSQLGEIDGLILPGGESSTMLKLLRHENLFDDVAEFGRRKPMFGTCAGAILMATDVTNPPQESLGLMDIAVERHAYGRQLDSRVVELDPEPEFEKRTAPGKLE